MAARLQRSIPIIRNERRAGENGADHFTLHSDAAAMNNPQCLEAQPVSFGEIFFHYRFDVARGNGVQIENIFYGDPDRFFGIGHKNEKPAGPRE